LLSASCQSDDSNNSPTFPQNLQAINNVNQSVQQGAWRITYYFDTDSDETSRYTNYTFTFGSGNVLTASNGTNTYTGTWLVTNSNSNDDNPQSDLDFNIAFSSPANFQDLTDDWDIVSYTATRIELIDISGGNGGTDHLVFEKIKPAARVVPYRRGDNTPLFLYPKVKDYFRNFT
jgi:hypothetical protein